MPPFIRNTDSHSLDLRVRTVGFNTVDTIQYDAHASFLRMHQPADILLESPPIIRLSWSQLGLSTAAFKAHNPLHMPPILIFRSFA